MDMPVNVPVDDPNADTEWNDILRQHGIIPEKPPDRTKEIEEALEEADRIRFEHRLEEKDLDELDELEDDEDEEFLEGYRRQRMGELRDLRDASVYGQVFHVQKPEYNAEVTEASAKGAVLVLLTSSEGMNEESRLMEELWRQLAQKFGEVKFCQMQGNLCIEGYPDRNTPTILVYKDKDIQRQIVTLKELKGANTSLEDLEGVLLDCGAVKYGDWRLRSKEPKVAEGESGVARWHVHVRAVRCRVPAALTASSVGPAREQAGVRWMLQRMVTRRHFSRTAT